MKPDELVEAVVQELARVTGIPSVLEAVTPERSEVHLRILLGAVNFNTEDEGLDGGALAEFRFVLTLQAKGPGTRTWINKVISGCSKLAKAFGGGPRPLRLTIPGESIPGLIKGDRTSTPDRQMYKSDQPGETPFEYFETWSISVLVAEGLLDL